MNKKYKNIDLAKLAQTRDDRLLIDFPKSVYGKTRGELRELRSEYQRNVLKMTPQERVAFDKHKTKITAEKKDVDEKYQFVLKENEKWQKEYEALKEVLDSNEPFSIKKSEKVVGGESTAFAILSDWHFEERVSSDKVNGANEYNLEIAGERASQLFRTLLKLTDIEAKNDPIKDIVLLCLGDFITGYLHEDNLVDCQVGPIEATKRVKAVLIAGIQYLLDNSKYNIKLHCHVGNHGRMTKYARTSESENDNSIETTIYASIADKFEGNDRVYVHQSPGRISFMDVYDTKLRLQHGHSVKGNGGVGGLSIPLLKNIGRWNDHIRADIDIMGHHHTKLYGGNFIVNGSMIGFNAYAQDNNMRFEPPSQTFFIINSRWKGPIVYRPIYFDK